MTATSSILANYPAPVRAKLSRFASVTIDSCEARELRAGDLVEYPVNSWTFELSTVVEVSAAGDEVVIVAAAVANKRRRFSRSFPAAYRHALLVCA